MGLLELWPELRRAFLFPLKLLQAQSLQYKALPSHPSHSDFTHVVLDLMPACSLHAVLSFAVL